MKRLIFIICILVTLSSCKNDSVLDQLTREDSITISGELVFIGNSPFQNPALRIEGIEYPIQLDYKDRTIMEKTFHMKRFSTITATGTLERVVKKTPDDKYEFIVYVLTIPDS
jgi:hypothetical protein